MPKIETQEEFAFVQEIESVIVPKYAESPNGRGGLITISKDYTWAVKLIAARDTAIRSECANRAVEYIAKHGFAHVSQNVDLFFAAIIGKEIGHAHTP